MDTERERIESMVRSWFEENLVGDVELLEVRLKGSISRPHLVVVVDRVGGITVDDLTRTSRVIEDLLDRKDPILTNYELEVSSPGSTWQLKNQRDFERNSGRLVEIVHISDDRTGVEVRINGKVWSVNDQNLVLQSSEGDLIEVDLNSIISAKKSFDFKSGKQVGSKTGVLKTDSKSSRRSTKRMGGAAQ